MTFNPIDVECDLQKMMKVIQIYRIWTSQTHQTSGDGPAHFFVNGSVVNSAVNKNSDDIVSNLGKEKIVKQINYDKIMDPWDLMKRFMMGVPDGHG